MYIKSTKKTGDANCILDFQVMLVLALLSIKSGALYFQVCGSMFLCFF